MSINTFVCVSSTACQQEYPLNTPSKFTNRLPAPIENIFLQRLYIKVHSVFLGNEFAEGVDEVPGGVLQVRIEQVEQQVQGRQYQNVSGTFPFPFDYQEVISDDYGYHVFKHAPTLPTLSSSLTELQVTITDQNGEEVRLSLLKPTVIWLNITDRMMDDQFTITSVSHQPNLFPSNTLSAFTAPLPQEMDFDGFQVALLQLIYPPRMRDKEELASLTLDDHTFVWNLNDYEDTASFIKAVATDIKREKRIAKLFQFSIRQSGGETVLWRKIGGKIRKKIKAEMNFAFARACGKTDAPQTATFFSPGDGIVFGIANIFNALPMPVSSLNCNIVETNVLAGRQSTALQLVPVMKFMHEHEARLYEPAELAYHDIKARPVSTLRFEFRDPDGSPKNFMSPNEEDSIVITLLFKRKQTPAPRFT